MDKMIVGDISMKTKLFAYKDTVTVIYCAYCEPGTC